jgi:1-deoxyxylulose-5-phosphate synthase
MPVLGFGAVTLGREIDKDASYSLLDHAYEKGFRIFDTAEAYGGGSSEILLGEWMRARGIRPEIEIHTKVSGDFTADGIGKAMRRSLERLQTDRVDGYYLHATPPALTEAVQALSEEKQAGRTYKIGISNATVDALSTAHRVAPLDLCQNIYNLAQPQAEEDVLPWCVRHDVAFVAYSPLGAGFLTGKYGARGEISPKGTRFDLAPGHRDVYFRPECFSALERLTAAAAETGQPAYRLALEWVLRRTDIAIVLIGATRPEYLDNALAALSAISR